MGHQEYRCPNSFEQAGANIRRRIHVARPDPESNFWVTQNLDLYSRAVKVYSDSNINRTTKIEILWAEDALEDDVLEVLNSDGSRITFFVHHADFPAFDNDPSESLDDDDPTEPSNDGDTASSHDSQRTVMEPLNIWGGDDEVSGQDNGGLVNHQLGSHRYELDASFETALNALDLTSDEENIIISKKRQASNVAESSLAKRSQLSDINTGLDLNVGLHVNQEMACANENGSLCISKNELVCLPE